MGVSSIRVHQCASVFAGCLGVVLNSAESDPALCAQRGPAVTILRRGRLADLPVDEVIANLSIAC